MFCWKVDIKSDRNLSYAFKSFENEESVATPLHHIMITISLNHFKHTAIQYLQYLFVISF